MRKVNISVQQCKPGMQVAENIFNIYGAIILYEDTLLDLHLINKLSLQGIESVRVYDVSDEETLSKSETAFQEEYRENIEAVRDLLHDLNRGKSLNPDKIESVSESIFARINENRDVVGCINQVRSVDEYTYTHSLNVSLLSMLIGKWMKMDPEAIKKLVQSALLHDIGKCFVPNEVLNKPGKLTPEEYREIQKHPVFGYRMAEKMEGIRHEVLMGILMHHEREDGSGYPIGVKGTAIHEFAKIIAVADIYDAMTSNRVYRGKESPFEIFNLMENNAFGVLDPCVTAAFLNNLAFYYIGDQVRLNTGETGEIIYINPRCISRPVVKAGMQYIDLSTLKDRAILELV